MRHWRLFLIVILCCALPGGYGLLGCGDDDEGGNDGGKCWQYCNKIDACTVVDLTPEEIEECTRACNERREEDPNNPERECTLNCDTSASCEDWRLCVEKCELL